MSDKEKTWLDVENDGRSRRKLDKYINGFFGLSDLNYIKPFRRLMHMILIRLHIVEAKVDEIKDSPSMEEFEALEKRVSTNEDNIEGLDETKADKDDLDDLAGHVDDLDGEIDDVQTEIDETNDNLSELEKRVQTNAEGIESLVQTKADKTDLEDTNDRVTALEGCCEVVDGRLNVIDGRLDADEDNINTLLDNMIVLTGHDGIIATDTYFENVYEISMDDMLMQMLNAGIMEYCVYTSVYDTWDNWIKQIQEAVKDIYDYEWNNFGFINVRRVQFGGTSPRPMIELIPRERDVYICLDYTGDSFVGHCFMHRTDLTELETRMSAAEERLDADEANITQNASDIERLTEDMDHTGERLTAIDRAIEALEQADADFEGRISYLEGCCDEVKSTIEYLESDIEDCRKHADEATKEAKEATEAAKTAQEMAEQAAADADTAKEAAEEAAEKVGEYDERLTKAEGSITDLEACCENVQQELENKANKEDIPEKYVSSVTGGYGYTGSSSESIREEHTITNVVTVDSNSSSSLTAIYSGDMAGLEVEKTENDDGSTTYALTPQFMGGTNYTIRTHNTYEIDVPAKYDDTKLTERIDDLEAQPMELQGMLVIDGDADLYEGEEFSGTVSGAAVICLDASETDAFTYMSNNDIDSIDAYFALDSVRKYKVTISADGSVSRFTGAVDDYGVFEIDGQSAVINYANGKTRLMHNSIAGYALNVQEIEYKNFEVYNEDNETVKLYHRKVKEIPAVGSTYEGETVTASKEFDITNNASNNSVRSIVNSGSSVSVEIVDDGFEAAGYSLFGGRNYVSRYISSIVGLNKFDTSNVTDMRDMFYNCYDLSSLDVSSFDTANVTRMEDMFLQCSALTSLDLSNFNTSNVTNMSGMFRNCYSLTSLDVSSFDTSNVIDMSHMFYSCNALTTIYAAADQFNVESVDVEEGGGTMFTYCLSLVGGQGTTYINSRTDYTYAHVDGGEANPGYFTEKA